MDEIEIQSNLCCVANVAMNKLNQRTILQFEVWLHNYDHSIDIEVTDKLTVEQLQSLKNTYLEKYEAQIEAKREMTAEDHLEADADRKMDEDKIEQAFS